MTGDLGAHYDCQECGMNVASAQEFHPYWYCVLFKGGVDPHTYPDLVKQRATSARLREAERLLDEGVKIGDKQWAEKARRFLRSASEDSSPEELRDFDSIVGSP